MYYAKHRRNRELYQIIQQYHVLTIYEKLKKNIVDWYINIIIIIRLVLFSNVYGNI